MTKKFTPFQTEETSGFKDNSLVRTTGRGAQSNFSSRFDGATRESDLESYGWFDEAEDVSLLRTQFLKDSSKSIITENNSPDLPFTYGLNPYRGCEHGCAYCFARPTHEYLGLSPGLDFESKIFVKYDAPKLLREKLQTPSWTGERVFMSGVTDCYQPAERKFALTRGCLEVFAEFRNPVSVITKNQLVCRDIDLFQELANFGATRVFLSVTTLNADLARVLEPRTSAPQSRLKAIETLAKAGIPVGVNVAPIFTEWLTANAPERKERVLKAIRDVKGGKLNDSSFGGRMRGTGPQADNVRNLFKIFSEKYGLNKNEVVLSSEHFRKIAGAPEQMGFDLS